MRRRLEEIYNDYAAKVLPKEAGAVQRKETRQAFFVGAYSVMIVLNDATAPGADEAAIVNELKAEFEAFAESAMKAGGRHA